jgi:hypothetical protein
VKISVWSETADPEELRADATLRLLTHYGVSVRLAVTAGNLDACRGTLSALRGANIPVAIWPMAGDAEGRWASASACRAYLGWSEHVLSVLLPALHAGDGWVLDLEPAKPKLDRLLQLSHLLGGASAMDAQPSERASVAREPKLSYGQAERALGAWVAKLHEHGLWSMTTSLPHVALPGERLSARLLGLPRPHTRQVDCMLYTSLFEGWSLGLLNRARARMALTLLLRSATTHMDPSGHRSISLGLVGTGAFGSEPTYRTAAELREDAAAVAAAGFAEVCLFDLGGILRDANPKAWFDAVVGETG